MRNFRRKVALAFLLWTLAGGTRTDGKGVASQLREGLPGVQQWPDKNGRPRIALVLSGGGARGFAHVGILKALEEAGVPFDGIVGTSMGAIVGSLFACGYTPQQIEDLVKSIDWVKLLRSQVPRPTPASQRYGVARGIVSLRFRRLEPKVAPGLLPAQRVYELLLRHTGRADAAFGGEFDSLLVPIRVVTADLKQGQLVTFRHGHLAKCILASMAIPFFFPPVQWGDWLLVDGGLLDNTPVDVARAWGADIVIAVDVSSIGEREVRFDDMIDIFRRTMDIWMTRTNQLYREKPNLLLRPYLEQRSPLDYPAADTMIALGYRYAMRMIDSVRTLVPWKVNWADRRHLFLKKLTAKSPREFAGVRLLGLEHTRQAALRSEISVRTGSRFDVGAVLRDVRSLYATGLFDQVMARFESNGASTVTVVYEFREREQFDLSLGGCYLSREGESGFLQFRHINIFGYGGQGLISWRFGPQRNFLAAELHARRFFGLPLFAHSTAFWERNRPWWYINGKPVSRREYELVGFQLSAGVKVGVGCNVSLMATAANGLRFSDPKLGLERLGWRLRSAELIFLLDRLDDVFWPTQGLFEKVAIRRSVVALGGTVSSREIEWDLVWYNPWRRMILGAMFDGGLAWGDRPVELWHRRGGPRSFQGLERGELWTPNFVSGTIEIQFAYSNVLRFALGAGLGWWSLRPSRLFRRDAFVGSRAGVRMLTPVGPVKLDVAYGEGGRRAYYLTVGYVF